MLEKLTYPYHVKELKKNRSKRTGATPRGTSIQMASMRETMTKRQPLFFDQRSEPVQRPVIRIQADLCDRCQLCGHVPAIF